MGFKQYTMPLQDSISGKWVFEVLDENEQLLERVECDSEQTALRQHRERFINDILNNDMLTEAR